MGSSPPLLPAENSPPSGHCSRHQFAKEINTSHRSGQQRSRFNATPSVYTSRVPEPPRVLLQSKTITVINRGASKRDRFSQSQITGRAWCSQRCPLHLATKASGNSVQNLPLTQLVSHSIQPPPHRTAPPPPGRFPTPQKHKHTSQGPAAPQPPSLAVAVALLHTQTCRTAKGRIICRSN